MADPDKRPVTMEELLVSSLAQTDALAKLLSEKGLPAFICSACAVNLASISGLSRIRQADIDTDCLVL
jgi:hypothetical protein